MSNTCIEPIKINRISFNWRKLLHCCSQRRPKWRNVPVSSNKSVSHSSGAHGGVNKPPGTQYTTKRTGSSVSIIRKTNRNERKIQTSIFIVAHGKIERHWRVSISFYWFPNAGKWVIEYPFFQFRCAFHHSYSIETTSGSHIVIEVNKFSHLPFYSYSIYIY